MNQTFTNGEMVVSITKHPLRTAWLFRVPGIYVSAFQSSCQITNESEVPGFCGFGNSPKFTCFFSILKEFEILTFFNFHHFFSTGTPQIPAIFFQEGGLCSKDTNHPLSFFHIPKLNRIFVSIWINRFGG